MFEFGVYDGWGSSDYGYNAWSSADYGYLSYASSLGVDNNHFSDHNDHSVSNKTDNNHYELLNTHNDNRTVNNNNTYNNQWPLCPEGQYNCIKTKQMGNEDTITHQCKPNGESC